MSDRLRLVLVLSENWTIAPRDDPAALVGLARQAEAAGVDGVMISEHIVLGPTAAAAGRMANPRDYALPGNQDPATPWPSSLVLLSAIAARTTTLRLVAGALIAPLRHPLLVAREIGTLDQISRGRLVVLPTVSWHEEEYEALGVPFRRRGRLLDEHLAAWAVLWRDSPATYEGEAYRFRDVWLEPKAFRPEGPRLWFGGSSVHAALLRRIVRYGSGFNPLGHMSDEELWLLARELRAAGRDPRDLEMVGGLRGTFPADDAVADLAQACEAVPEQLARGYTTFCFKPNQFTDDVARWSDVCREAVARVGEAAASAGGLAAAHEALARAGTGA